MNTPARYPEITASGQPRELGRQIGEQAREQVRGFCSIALQRVNKTVNISKQRAMDIAQQSLVYAEQYREDLVEELRGTAEAAGVSIEELMLLQVRNQLQDQPQEGCTSVGSLTAEGETLVAQTWDNDPALDAFTVVLSRYPDDRPASLVCTQAGLISYMGFSETGMGVCVNSLPAPAREVGVPHYFTLRELLESSSIDQGLAALQRAHRAIPANLMVASNEGPIDLEVGIDQVRMLRPDSENTLAHTNHCVHPSLAPINREFPELIQSHQRLQRMNRLLRGTRGDAAALKQILSDHDAHPRSICRHANDDPVHGFWETVFALVIDPHNRQMHVSRGTPCNHPFEDYRLA